jgi:hypothetical protein
MTIFQKGSYKEYKISKRMVARLLSDAPKHIQKMDEEAERLAKRIENVQS